MTERARDGNLRALVSVVIPTLNSAKMCAQAVGSVLAQTIPAFEVIVVNDGSSDDTVERILAIADTRVRVVSVANGGPARARNIGASVARGRYIAFLDSDDLWLPRKLERQLAMLGGSDGTRAVQTGVMRVDGDLRPLYRRPCRTSKSALLDTVMFRNLPAFPSTIVMERGLFDKIGGFDESLVILEDWDVAIKVARYGKMVSIEEPLALYRVHQTNRSRDVRSHVEPGFRVLDRLYGDVTLPEEIRMRRRSVYARFYMMLAGGYFRQRMIGQACYWGARAVWKDPRVGGYAAALPARRAGRVASRLSLARASGPRVSDDV